MAAVQTPLPALSQLSLRDKQKLVDQAKVESEVLQRHLIYAQQEALNTSRTLNPFIQVLC